MLKRAFATASFNMYQVLAAICFHAEKHWLAPCVSSSSIPTATLLCLPVEGSNHRALISLCANRLPRRESYHGQQFWELFLSSAWQPQRRHLEENFVFQACFQQGNNVTNQII